MQKRSSRLGRELGKQGPFDSPEQEAYLNLVRTTDQLGREFARLFKEHGVSDPQYNVLRILRGAGEAVAVQHIVSRMVSRQPDVTRLIDRLVAAGLVTRERCTSDRRVVWIKLAAAGTRLVRSLDKPVAALHRRQLGHLSQRDLQLLTDLLERARGTADDESSRGG